MPTPLSLPTIREAVAIFDGAEGLEMAIDELLSSGFDRYELSLLASQHAVEDKLGHAYEKVGELEDDVGVPRAAYVSTEAIGDAEGGLIGGLMYIGAVAASGAIVATGGTLAGAVVAAAMAGGAGGLIGAALARLIDYHHADHLARQLERGGLLLWVRTRDAEHEARALDILARHAARDVHLHDLPTPGALVERLGAGGLERALLDPTSVFDGPEQVLERADLTRDQKVLILRSWAYDARELEVAEEEGMVDGEPAMLDRVLAALDALGAPHGGTGASKQGGG
jgi:hypothetical protein